MAVKEKELTTEEKIQKKISDFALNNSKKILIAAVALVAVVIAIVIATTSVTKAREKAMITVSALSDTYQALDKDSESYSKDVEALIEDCKGLVGGKRYPSVKAQFLIGLCYFDTKDYKNAYDAFMQSYNLNKNIYLAQLALLNAAASADSDGDTDKALELYNQIASDYAETESAVVPKALFNAGRIYLQKGSKDLAKTTFEQLTASYSNSEFAKLAENVLNVL